MKLLKLYTYSLELSLQVRLGVRVQAGNQGLDFGFTYLGLDGLGLAF